MGDPFRRLRRRGLAARVHFALLDRIQRAQRFHRFVVAPARDEFADGLQSVADIRGLEGQHGFVDKRVGERTRVSRRGGIHQHDLDDEIDLPQRRGRVAGLNDVGLEQESDVVHQFERRLAVDADDGAVDVDAFAGSQGDVHGRLSSIHRE
jgi:hypothetical protein